MIQWKYDAISELKTKIFKETNKVKIEKETKPTIAQLVERKAFNLVVIGSSPISGIH